MKKKNNFGGFFQVFSVFFGLAILFPTLILDGFSPV